MMGLKYEQSKCSFGLSLLEFTRIREELCKMYNAEWDSEGGYVEKTFHLVWYLEPDGIVSE